MSATVIRSEERIGLGLAVVLHVGLVALLLWQPPKGDVMTPPDRIEVSISDEVALDSTSPEPNADSRPDTAPELGAPPAAEAQPEPQPPAPQPPAPQPRAEPPPPPKPRPVASPKPAPKPVPRPVPKPVAQPAPAAKPAPKPAPRPAPQPVAKPAAKPAPKPAAQPAAKPAAQPAAKPAAKPAAQPAAKPAAKPGGSRVGNDFLEGVKGARSTGASRNPPAQKAGPAVTSSLLGAISREIRPHWQGKVPEGADSEKLVTVLRWNLNRDGTLAGAPQVIGQEGITDANRPQAARHAEQAVRAVQLAAPFDLPEEYYDTWKRVTIKFDKRLAQ
jgi:membrane protein involved in colicin uptake